MSGDFPDSAGRTDNADWRDLDELLALTAAAAKAGGESRAFYTSFIGNLVQAFSGAMAGVWHPDQDGGFQLLADCRWNASSPKENGWPDQESLSAVAARPQPLLLPSLGRGPGGFVSSTDHPLLAGPVLDDLGRCAAVVIVTLDDCDLAGRRERTLELFEAFREIAADYHRREALKELLQRQRRQSLVEEFALRVHRRQDLEATAYTIVNDGRHLVGCDRLSLVTISGGQPRTRTVSGVDVVERRGAVLRALESLAAEVACAGEPVYCDRNATGDRDRSSAVEVYRDQSLAAALAAIPLFQPLREESVGSARVIAVLVLEWFTAPSRGNAMESPVIDALKGHAEAAIAQALAFERIPWATIWRKIDPWFAARASRRWTRTALVAGVLAALALLAWLVPADFTITARGRLQPVEQRAIFAPSDAVVAEILTDHNQRVTAGQLLLRLESPALELEAARIAGELATTEQQLRSVKAERWSAADAPERPERDASELAAEEESLGALAASLASQQEMIAQQQQQLEIRSPIAGNVVTWRAADLLQGRPVARGQELLAVANEDGPWRLEMDVPDGQFRHVLSAHQSSEAPLPVSFRLATEANITHAGQLGVLSGATQSSEDAQLVVPVEVSIERGATSSFRTGAQATARIHCGRRPIAYVWLHEVWEWLQSRFW